MTRGRKPRRPRTLRNPIEHAMLGATCLTSAERIDTLAPTRDCLDRLRRGVATEDQHTVLYTVLKIAEGIEGSRIVRGLGGAIQSALQAMDAIRARATAHGPWHPTALYATELAAIREAVHFHDFQLQHVSAGELHAIATKLIARTASSGGVVQHRAAGSLGLGAASVD